MRLIATIVSAIIYFAFADSKLSAQEATASPTLEQRVSALESYLTNTDPKTTEHISGPGHNAWMMTSAALVMVAVFFAFVVAGAPSLKELGTGLGVAILLDATLVRLLIVPAAMRLLGQWNWWLPKRLTRLLPAASH